MSALFNCLAATRLISKAQHQKLNLMDKYALKTHIVLCKYCNSFKVDLDYIKIKLTDIDKHKTYTLSEDFKIALNIKINQELNNI